VLGLVGSLSAEPQVRWWDAGVLVHSVVDKPLSGALLHAGAALGHQPDTAAEPPDQAGEGVQRPVDRRGAQHLLGTAVEERRVVPAGVVVAVDDDPADVDAEAGVGGSDRFHDRIIPEPPLEQN
jgi:hypothetical protein